MTFPGIASGLDIELDVNGWTSVVSRLDHGPLEIARGHPDESTTVSPSTLSMTLTNGDGALSPENAMSPYYPWMSQNVPCRVSLPAQQNYLRFEVDLTSNATCPDASGLHITGDIDIRVDIAPSSYTGSVIVAKWGVSGNFGWLLEFDPSGTAQFFWSTTGSDFPSATSTLPVPLGRLTLRVTLAVSTGTVTFWTGPAGNADASSGWTQLGSAVVNGSTSIFASTAVIAAGGTYGNYYELEVRSGIAGTVKAHPVFSAQTAGVTSFTDAQSNTWTLNGTAEISSRLYRGYFEVAEIPVEEPPFNPAADETAGTTDVLSAFAGGGLLRRESQRNNPLNSTMYRAWTRFQAAPLAAYWPMEDGAGSAQIASGNGGRPMYFSGAAPELAANSDFACSDALPVVNGASFNGAVAYSGTWTDNQVAFLLEIPAAAEADEAVIAAVYTTGTVALMTLRYRTAGAGSLELFGFNAAGSQLFDSTAVTFGLNGVQMLVAISLQNAGGGNITWHLDGFAVGAASPTGASGTVAGTVGAVTSVKPNRDGALLQTVTGHCAVLTEYQQLYSLFTYTNPFGLVTGALGAWAGEPAAVRFARLCTEEGIPYRITGPMNGTVLMGIQTAETLAQLLQECADADRGVWLELRQVLGWGYVCRSALYNQAAQVTASYSQDYLSPWKSPPTRDDQVIVNDVTLTQTNAASTSAVGSSSRAYAAPGQPVTGGRLSTLSPPAGGAGTYDQAYNINDWRASDLDNQATWIVHVGTADRRRFPGIALDLANRGISSTVFWAVLGLDLGQMIEITSPPPWLGYDPVTQLAQQLTETLDAFTIEIDVAGVPESPYEVAVAGSARADTAGSQLAGALGAILNANPFATGGSTAGWSPSHGTLSATSSPVAGASLPWAAVITADGTGTASAAFGASFAATAGTSYLIGALGAAPGGYPVQIGVNWFTSGGSYISTTAPSPVSNAGTWAPYAVAGTAPATTATGQPFLQLAASSGNVPAAQQLQVQALTASAGPFTVTTVTGNLWITTSAFSSMFPFDIGIAGERITVTAITSSTSPQTFAGVRAVNGVGKAQASGAAVALWNTPVAAL